MWGFRNPKPCQGGGNCGGENGKEGLGGATGIGTPSARQQETGGRAAQTLERGGGEDEVGGAKSDKCAALA